MRYCPDEPVIALREKPVASCLAVTFTSGTAADEGSVTIPSRLLEATWAFAAKERIRRNTEVNFPMVTFRLSKYIDLPVKSRTDVSRYCEELSTAFLPPFVRFSARDFSITVLPKWRRSNPVSEVVSSRTAKVFL
jgi:hypothetical protein